MVTRDIIKTGVNAPIIGPISIGGIFLILGFGYLFLRQKRAKKDITLRV